MTLKPHPDTPSRAVATIEVEVFRQGPSPDTLVLVYNVHGELDGLLLPPAGEPARADNLWQRTCFEAFIRTPVSEGYYELNFSPSRQWAAYRFSGYRQGRADAAVAERVRVKGDERYGAYQMRAIVDGEDLPGANGDEPWRMAITAVIEETDGTKSYWALAHAPGKPDFHHVDGFVLDLPADAS